MSLKQLFYGALIARLISWFALAGFFACLVFDIELRTAIMALGLSHLAWMLGTMFLGVFREQMVEITTRVMTDMIEEAGQEEEPVTVEKLFGHPVFEDDKEETNE